MKNTSKFQNVVIATIVGWLVLFVFLPNLMIIATSFLTRDDVFGPVGIDMSAGPRKDAE